jgi:hypothetical protein
LEGKEAGVSGERMTTENGLLWLRLSPSLASARERRDNALAIGERCGGEKWCEGRVAWGGGFYSCGKER